MRNVSKKLLSRAEVSAVSNSLKQDGKKVVFTNGCFDILHVGHIELLESAKSLGDILVVGLNSDDSVKRLKGTGRPINSVRERVRILSALEFVDYVVIFNEDTPYKLLQEVKPDFLIKGGDYSLDEIVGRNIVESYGGKVKVIQLLKGKSTTDIINKIMQSERVKHLDNK
ncbi:MAG: D-glycero-beta-D-manno-heptose 1-phosphate adenylyltransferase [Candidatus Neomarinimicrobiota bacterium]|nr:MAG: D-glycero-beta-D-manno-heptose 1-phosphate adenylyltransferase [Candidatus Neomarinimicrobiota bacterium]